MTEFDRHATPLCDKHILKQGDIWIDKFAVPLGIAQRLEVEARIAGYELEQTKKKLGDTEEKLRIAIITLKELADPNSLFDSVLFSQSQLEEIERVGL